MSCHYAAHYNPALLSSKAAVGRVDAEMWRANSNRLRPLSSCTEAGCARIANSCLPPWARPLPLLALHARQRLPSQQAP